MASTALVPTSTRQESRDSTRALVEWIKLRKGVEAGPILQGLEVAWTLDGHRPVRAAIEQGLLEPVEVRALITAHLQTIHLDPGALDPVAAGVLGVERSERLQALGYAWEPGTEDLIVVTAEPPTPAVKAEVEDVANPMKVVWRHAPQAALASCIDSLSILLSDYQDDGASAVNLGVQRQSTAAKNYETLIGDMASPISRSMHKAITQTIAKDASDLHIETVTRQGRVAVDVRLRIDGKMTLLASYPPAIGGGIINRFKVAASMSMNATVPGDGHIEISLPNSGDHFDLRVHYDPLHVGSTVVVRVLAQERAALADLASIFPMSESPLLAQLRDVVHRPDGIFLVAGRTGDGKSTTMAAILSEVCDPTKKVVTAENPVEYHIPGAQQVQVTDGKEDGHTFAKALRGFLRADPDVIMVGEVRDVATAEMAVRAAQTGHSVISTIHVRDAAAAPQRLLELGGTSASALADTLTGVLEPSRKRCFYVCQVLILGCWRRR